MSIINKMLQDLDRRNGRSGGERMAGDAIRSIKPESPWHLGRNIVLAIVGLGVASLAGAWWVQQRNHCLLYTSPSPRDRTRSRMPSSA